MQDPKLIVVRSYGSRIEAELAKGALEIVIREGDATIARDVLTPVESNESPDADQTDLDPPESWRRLT